MMEGIHSFRNLNSDYGSDKCEMALQFNLSPLGMPTVERTARLELQTLHLLKENSLDYPPSQSHIIPTKLKKKY